MDFHAGDLNSLQCIQKRNAGVRIRCRIHDDPVIDPKRLLDPVNERALVIGLKEIHFHIQRLRGKIGADRIETIVRYGYRFREDV